MKKIYNICDIKDLNIAIKVPSIVYLYGDLGAGKTTMSKHIINDLFGYKGDVTSPTYTYYNKYSFKLKAESGKGQYNNKLEAGSLKLETIYHFDLYRLKNYDEFFAIGGEDVFDNNTGIILVEWPEILEGYYKPDLIITLNKTDNEDEREIELIYN